MLRQQLNEWVEKVVKSHETSGMIDTFQMIVDVDKIIADAFGRDSVIMRKEDEGK